jgi:Tfp pilus assembly protein PilX
MQKLVSMFNISLPQANALYNIANIVLILGAFLVLLGTIIAIWTGGIRERFADERMSNNETETARAKADAAQADAHAAEVNLELAKLKAPRTLGGEQQSRLVSKLKPFAGQTFSLKVVADTEPISLMSMIETVLASAGWVNIPSQIGDVQVGGAGMAYGTAVELQMPPIGNPEAWEKPSFLHPR